jgi:hypothetical protein
LDFLFRLNDIAAADCLVAEPDFSAIAGQYRELVPPILAGDDDRCPWGDWGVATGGALPMGLLYCQSGTITAIVCDELGLEDQLL